MVRKRISSTSQLYSFRLENVIAAGLLLVSMIKEVAEYVLIVISMQICDATRVRVRVRNLPPKKVKYLQGNRLSLISSKISVLPSSLDRCCLKQQILNLSATPRLQSKLKRTGHGQEKISAQSQLYSCFRLENVIAAGLLLVSMNKEVAEYVLILISMQIFDATRVRVRNLPQKNVKYLPGSHIFLAFRRRGSLT